SQIGELQSSDQAQLFTNAGLTVAQAYAIDSKTDDGYPLSGRVTAQCIGGSSLTSLSGGAPFLFPSPSSGRPPPYDNRQTPKPYSVKQNNGSGVNCGLTFRFQ